MLTRRVKVIRFLIGAGVTLVILITAMTALHFWIPTRGALHSELAASSYPGDELVPDPDLLWMHAVTIQAPPEGIWPWLIQIGDTRGGFYSYTFIENLIAGERLYINASQVNLAWQTPLIGQGIIDKFMRIREYQTPDYILAKDEIPLEGFAWTWLWRLTPTPDGQATRLVVRHRIRAPQTPILLEAVNLAGYVMEWRMLLGIRARAEGRSDPSYMEGIETALWLLALLQGLIAAALFITLPRWQPSLAVGIAAVLILLILTYIQPAVWVRFLLNLLLLAGLRLAQRPSRPVKR